MRAGRRRDQLVDGRGLFFLGANKELLCGSVGDYDIGFFYFPHSRRFFWYKMYRCIYICCFSMENFRNEVGQRKQHAVI